MADFNFTDLLSLDKAKLFKRSRMNFLGTKELILDYNLQTSGAKEEALDWLADNRTSLTDPKFGFKTYTGTWQCVSIEFNEDKKTIRQRFKIDGVLEDNRSEASALGSAYRSYYWKIVDPDKYNIPDLKTTGTNNQGLDGSYWYDTGSTANGKAIYYDSTDTYASWYDGSDYVISLVSDGFASTPTNRYYENSTPSVLEGTYTAAGTFTGTPALALITNTGEEWRKIAQDNGDGTFDVIIEKNANSEYEGGGGTVRHGSESEDQGTTYLDSIWVSGKMTNAAAAQEYEHTGGTIGETSAVWTGVTTSSWTISFSVGNGWIISNGGADEAVHPYLTINSSEWYDGGYPITTSSTYRDDLVVQIGRNPPEKVVTTEITTNSTEQSFVKDGGSVANPTQGQIKTISNIPLENGLFRTTITTETANLQRIPAINDSIVFASDGNYDETAIIVARNATYEQFQLDVNILQKQKHTLSNSVSVNINKYGLYDYTIRSIET